MEAEAKRRRKEKKNETEASDVGFFDGDKDAALLPMPGEIVDLVVLGMTFVFS